MSTRALITLTDNGGHKLNFYRHSDGYPESVVPSLNILMGWVKDGFCRRDLMQTAGWLIIIGNKEYQEQGLISDLPQLKSGYLSWKVGAYEPTPYDHGDIDHFYTLNIETLELKVDGKVFKAKKSTKKAV